MAKRKRKKAAGPSAKKKKAKTGKKTGKKHKKGSSKPPKVFDATESLTTAADAVAAAVATLTVTSFKLDFSRKWNGFTSFQLQVKAAEDNKVYVLAPASVSDHTALICAILNRIAAASAQAGWTFQSKDGLIVG